MRLAVADAFDLGRMQRVDLLSPLMLALFAQPAAEHERMGEDAVQFGVAPDLAHDVACDPADSVKGRRAFGYHQGQRSDQAAPKAGYTIANDPSVGTLMSLQSRGRPYMARSSPVTSCRSTDRR